MNEYSLAKVQLFNILIIAFLNIVEANASTSV